MLSTAISRSLVWSNFLFSLFHLFWCDHVYDLAENFTGTSGTWIFTNEEVIVPLLCAEVDNVKWWESFSANIVVGISLKKAKTFHEMACGFSLIFTVAKFWLKVWGINKCFNHFYLFLISWCWHVEVEKLDCKLTFSPPWLKNTTNQTAVQSL